MTQHTETVTVTVVTCDRCQRQENDSSPNDYNVSLGGWINFWPEQVLPLRWHCEPETICPDCVTPAEAEMAKQAEASIPF